MDELDAAELALAELTARVDQALSLHQACDCEPPNMGAHCNECGESYPCRTALTLDPLAAAPSVRPLGGAIAALPKG